jgi:hypothetical protein
MLARLVKERMLTREGLYLYLAVVREQCDTAAALGLLRDDEGVQIRISSSLFSLSPPSSSRYSLSPHPPPSLLPVFATLSRPAGILAAKTLMAVPAERYLLRAALLRERADWPGLQAAAREALVSGCVALR